MALLRFRYIIIIIIIIIVIIIIIKVYELGGSGLWRKHILVEQNTLLQICNMLQK